MKKVLIGVGIGCGVLMLLGAVVMVGVGYFVTTKVGGAVESTERMQAQGQKMKALDEQFAFTPPPQGQVLELDEARLVAYLAVRESALPIFQKYQQQLEGLNKPEGQEASLSDALQAGSMGLQLMSEARDAYLEHLEKQRMSPREYHAITVAIYNSHLAESSRQAQQGMNDMVEGQREGLQEALATLEEQLRQEGLSEEQRTELQEQAEALQAQLDAVGEHKDTAVPAVSEGNQATAQANLALMAKYKERIEKAVDTGLDALLIGADGSNPYEDMGNLQLQGE